MQDLGSVRGRRVFDNGVSTTPDSTIAALEALGDPAGPREPGDAAARPCRLLCGGKAKRGLALAPLVKAARGRVALAIAFGQAAPELEAAFRAGGVPVRASETLAEALRIAFDSSPGEEPVLFSPACASFDAYPNFLARAREFRAAIEALR